MQFITEITTLVGEHCIPFPFILQIIQGFFYCHNYTIVNYSRLNKQLEQNHILLLKFTKPLSFKHLLNRVISISITVSMHNITQRYFIYIYISISKLWLSYLGCVLQFIFWGKFKNYTNLIKLLLQTSHTAGNKMWSS